jgi:[ribosomal protein S18]-alanine N-acetyltransferase
VNSYHPILVRPLSYSDLPQVIGIERRAFPTPWSLAMFVLELSKPSGVCLSANRSGRVAGYLICSKYDQAWHLMNIAVDPPHRRQGIAILMLNRMFEIAGPGAAYTLEVRTSNAGAMALYERFGFKAVGTRRRYYQDTGEDAVIMWRTSAPVSSDGLPEPEPSGP